MPRLKDLLAENKLVRVFGLGQLCDPKFVEMIGFRGGYDAVWIDQEHCGLSLDRIEAATRAARAVGLDSFVRLTATDYATVMRPLEAGSGGIMAAQVQSAAEAEQIVRWAKFQPRGLRGIHGGGVDGQHGMKRLHDYMRQANSQTFVAIQIENQQAVDEVEKIAAVPDVDVLFIGPADLSQSMGITGQWAHPQLWEAIERVARAAREKGIHWAILPFDLDSARRCVALGCKMLAIGLDVWAVTKGLQSFQQEYAEFFPAAT
jgi:2-dehydro-3-deoxyglucarate aldolase/4-hydroxy-2-oxoheptanedioate aldolase